MMTGTRPKAASPASMPIPGAHDPDLDHPLEDGPESMNLDGEGPPRLGGKRQTEREEPSPTRHRGETRAATLDDIRGLLMEQTRSLTESHQQDLHELKSATFKELGSIKKDVRMHGDYIAQIRDTQDKFEERLRQLEDRATGSTTAGSDSGRQNLMIFGGWPQDTQREVLLEELTQCLVRLGLQNTFEDYFCTGPRRGFAMALLSVESRETSSMIKRRMITIAQQVQKANITTPNMEQGKCLRASLGKRLILTIDPNMHQHLDTEYAAGNVWLRARLISSATRQPPHPGCAQGKLDKSWIDLQAIAEVLHVDSENLDKQWHDLMLRTNSVQSRLAGNAPEGGDFNTKLRWTDALDPQGDLRPTEARSEYVMSELGTCGLQMRARGHQIDGMAYKGARPRMVTKKPPVLDRVNQPILQKLASAHTKPKPSTRYIDPPEVKDLYRTAKRTKREQDWKAAHKARRTAQERWRTQQHENAAEGQWQSFRHLKAQGGTEWTVHYVDMAEQEKQEPQKWTVEHFRKLFQCAEPRNPPRWDKAVDTGHHFTLEDLRAALTRGKTNKAVGEDLVSFELIRSLCDDTTTEASFLEWMERIRCGEEMPKEWLRTVVTLLPKSEKPRGPKDLRPISVGASAAKVFGTMLLMRTRKYIQPAGPWQCAHGGRQTADYLCAAVKTFSLDTEWRLGLCWCKVDIQKAFDTLSRDRTLRLLRDQLPPEMFLEFKCWERLFYEGTAVLRTPWGDAEIAQGRGIRQGSVESPFLFAIAIEMAIQQCVKREDWPTCIPAAPDLPLAELLYMDDTILWAAGRAAMVKKYQIFKEELARWGLKVNPEKTSFYQSPHSTSPGPIVLDGMSIQPAASLQVFGIPLSVPLKPTALMDTAMAKASKKFCVNKHIFMARAPLKHKLKTFRAVVGGAALWYSSAITPTSQAKVYERCKTCPSFAPHGQMVHDVVATILEVQRTQKHGYSTCPGCSVSPAYMAMKLPLKFWLFVGWTTTAAGIDSPARDAWGPTGTNIIPTAAEFDTHAKHYEHHDDTTTSDSKDDKKARTSRSRSSTPAGEPHGFQGNEYDHDQDSMQSEYYEQKRWEDDEEVSTFQLAPSTSVLWPGIATMVSMTAGFDEFAPGEAPAWFWAMVDQGQELVRDGADGERLGAMLLQALLDLDDRQLLADMDLHYNGILRAIHQDHDNTEDHDTDVTGFMEKGTRDRRTPKEEPTTPEEMTLDDALAVWKALFEFEQLELGAQSDNPVLPQGLLDNIVETLVDRPMVEHQVLIEALPTFLGKLQIDIATALERAKNLRRRLEGDEPASSTDPPTNRGADKEKGTDEHKPDYHEEYDDEAVYMQTDIREAINSPKKEMPLLDKLHRAFLQLRPSTASSRALRLMSLLQDHNPEDYLAVDRGALEALLVAINSETPPMPQADELLMEHSWCNIWWGRLRGQDHPGYDDSELELHHVEEVQAARERAIREAEEADQDARELAMQRRMEEMAEQHMEQLKSSETQRQDDMVMEAALGHSQGRPKKRLCVGICITDGVQTKAWDWELAEDRPLQVHIRAEARTIPGQWYRAGRPIPDRDVPEVLRNQDTGTGKGEESKCKSAPRFAYDLQKPATQELHRRWKQGEISDQTLVSIAGIDMLAFFQANEEITPDELQNLSHRDTMDLQPVTVPDIVEPVPPPQCAPTQIHDREEAQATTEDSEHTAEREEPTNSDVS
ncbi:unnamed protein product [Symbiodinium microadriaticum]|nr:unnamed protein product [Symbiodinium microadriaticum]